jgi:hypothetical protein
MRDVLGQLRSRKLITAHVYLSTELPQINQEELTAEGRPPCRVCGIGAVFICAVRLFNKFDRERWDAGRRSVMVRFLRPLFGGRELKAIENLYEGDDSVQDLAPRFCGLSDNQRLGFIAQYVIDRKGRKFVLGPATRTAEKFATSKRR